MMQLINQNIKKFLLHLSRAGRLIILACSVPKRNFWFGALLFFVISGLLFPLYPAHAILHGFAADAIGKAIGWMIAALILTVPTAMLTIASILLGWSIDPWFITLPYTSGGVVDVGWPVVRDLANMFIVLALVIIGLATALRLEEYRARKTLPLLIGVALLINFTPVILGVIVDFANIFMNFFLGGLTGGKIIGSVFTNISNMIASDLGGFNFFNPIALLGFFIKILVIAIFMAWAAVVFLLFAILFIMRRVAIWMLVIISPIAFVFYILPATRSWFRLWWNQFLQWTFIGVFAAFFLWLGDHMIGIASRGGLTGAVGDPNPVAAILNDVMPYGIALAFLLIGFFAALSTSAMGASGVISIAQKAGKAMPKIAGAAGVSTARGIPAVARTEQRIRQRLERTPLSGLVGGPGAYASELERDRKKAGRNLGAESVENIRGIAEKGVMTREGRLTRAAAIEELAKRDRLEAKDQRYFGEAIKYGVSPRMLYGKMPTAAVAGAPGVSPGMTTEESIRGHVERQETREFRRNILPQAFETQTPDGPKYTDENLQVFYSMDMAKVQELGRTGNKLQKDALRNLINQREKDITDMIRGLTLTGTPKAIREAEKVEAMWINIQGNPNYQT